MKTPHSTFNTLSPCKVDMANVDTHPWLCSVFRCSTNSTVVDAKCCVHKTVWPPFVAGTVLCSVFIGGIFGCRTKTVS